MDLKARLAAATKKESVYPPASTKTERPTNNIDTSKLEIKTGAEPAYYAAHQKMVIKANGTKVYPDKDGRFRNPDKETKEILEYYVSIGYGLIKKV